MMHNNTEHWFVAADPTTVSKVMFSIKDHSLPTYLISLTRLGSRLRLYSLMVRQ